MLIAKTFKPRVIQGIAGGKVNILAVHSIGHFEKKNFNVRMFYTEQALR